MPPRGAVRFNGTYVGSQKIPSDRDLLYEENRNISQTQINKHKPNIMWGHSEAVVRHEKI